MNRYSDRRKVFMDSSYGMFPWEIHQHTLMDVERAVTAFTRLLDAIETRLPSKSIDLGYYCGQKQFDIKGIPLPYSESVIQTSFIKSDFFLEVFLSALSLSM